MGEEKLGWQHFESAIEFNRRIGAPLPVLFAQGHYVRALLRGRAADRARGRSRLTSVMQEAQELGWDWLRHAEDGLAGI
jgi:hypothetical protein